MELILEHLTKSYRKHQAVQDVSVHLGPGVHGLLGANGSGKTTLLRMICGILPADKGDIMFDGLPAMRQYDTYVSYLGYLPQHFGYYPHYTVREFLKYMGILKNLSASFSEERIDELLVQLHLKDKEHKKLKHLSGGMLRRVGIAQALLNKPKILILDEPSAGLDPKERIIFRNLIASLATDCIILLSTHIVSDVETIADDILVMKEGRILLQNTVEELLSVMRDKVWEVTLPRREARVLCQNEIIVKQHTAGEEVQLRIVGDHQIHPLARQVKPDLDDLYLYYFQDGDELCFD